MSLLSTDTSASGKPGNERRLAQRFALDTPARLYLADNDVLNVAVKNFCVGGLYLTAQAATPESQRLRGLPKGAEVVVESRLAGEQAGTLRLHGRLMRHDNFGVGLSFVDPDPLTLQQIQAYILVLIANGQRPLPESHDTVDYSRIIQHCDDVILDSVGGILNKFCSSVVDELFDASKDIKDLRTQNAYFNAMGIINKNKPMISGWFTEAIVKGLEHREDNMVEAEANLTDIKTDSLSLVEETEFEDWLAASGVVDSVFSKYRELLNELNRRMSIIFKRKIDKNNNPYGPMLYANALQEALEQLGLEHVVNLAMYKVLNHVLMSELGGVFSALNKILIEHNIQPEQGQIIKREERPAPKPKPEPEARATTGAGAGAAGGGAGGGVAGSAGDDSGGGAGGEAKAAAEPGATASGSREARPIISPTEALDLYDLVQDLRQLRQSVNQGAAGGGAAGGAPGGQSAMTGQGEAQAVSYENYSPTEVIDALTALESRGRDRNDGKSIKDRVIDALRKSSDDPNKVIAEHDDKVITVTTDIFDSMMHDLQVAAALKTWLEKLEIPLMKIALVDDTIFTDRSHIARDVINKIAMLELSGNESKNEVQRSIKSSLEWLVNLMNEEFDGSSEVFKRVSDQLDLLTKIQATEYQKNVEKVAELSAKNKALNKQNEEEKRISEEFAAQDERRKEALKRVRRLKEGDWVVFELRSDDPSRLRVAWVASHTEKLVFVNLLGEKDRTITMVKLAEQLINDTAQILDNADDPIMDRAQYSMLQELHEKLMFETTHDPLTGLLNRREFEHRLEEMVAASKAANTRHMLCYMDFDQFDLVNSSYGYEAGDELLKQVAATLSEAVDGRGVVARIGSDEFGVLVEECGLEDAIDQATEYLDMIHVRGFSWNDKKVTISMSAGLVPISAQSESHTNLLQEAEASCRVAKEIGGNRVQVYQPGHSRLSKRSESIKWAAKVDEVIENNAFSLRCQRIVPVMNEEAYQAHYEILLNVFDKDGAPLPLYEFIQAAETYNRMPAVDRWVVKTAFNWISTNQDYLGDISTLSINLSGKSINDDDFLYFIEEQIAESDVPTEYICFEITETAGIDNLSTAAEFIKRVQKTGCRFSLDDFGSGLSSYGYLKNLPVDYLKIDGMFVREMANSPSDYAVVKSITEIGHFMGKYVIAEFVENDEVMEMLRQIGVDFAQGYGVEKPVELEQLLVG